MWRGNGESIPKGPQRAEVWGYDAPQMRSTDALHRYDRALDKIAIAEDPCTLYRAQLCTNLETCDIEAEHSRYNVSVVRVCPHPA